MRSSLAVPVILQPAIRMHPKQKESLAGKQNTEFWKCAATPGTGRKRIQTAIRSKIVEIHQNVCFVENRHFFVEIFVKNHKIVNIWGMRNCRACK